MEFFEVIEKRRSVRNYKPLSVRNEDLKRILEAARLAPSAGNRQPWRFIVVRTSEQKKLLAQTARNQMFLADAGVIIVALADSEASLKWCKQDVMIAVEHLVLASTSLGYGTCWIGAFEEEQVKQLLGIPEEMAVVALLPIGVPDEGPQAKPRKSFSEIFFEDEYNRPLKL
jgi:nitroreductase